MKTSWTVHSLVLLGAVSTGFAEDTRPTEFPLYVGQAICLECHPRSGSSESSSGVDVNHTHDGSPAIRQPGLAPGGPCTLKPNPKHNHTYELLSKEEARSIAALSGIVDRPTDSRICLSCHAAAADEGPRWTTSTFSIEDGVQCEACHGAGSLHVEAVRSKSAPGMLDKRPLIRRGDHANCKLCHVEKPSHHAVLKEGFTLSPADYRYKTPVNLAVSANGERIYVVCEHSDSVIVVDSAIGAVVKEIPVGRRPHDAALSPDGTRVYVSNRMSASLSVIDTSDLRVIAEITVGHEPHGVVVDPTGKKLVVLNTADDTASIVDLESLTESRRLVMGIGPWSIALSEDGRTAYATSVRPNPGRFRDPPRSEISVIDVQRGVVTSRHLADGANMLEGIDYLPHADVALFTLMRTKNLIPTSRLAQGWVITNGLGVVWPDGRVDQILLDEPNESLPDLMDVAVSPDGRRALVVSAGADQVAVVDVPSMLEVITSASDRERAEVLPNHMGKSGEFIVARIAVGRNPRAVAYSPDGRYAYIANALDDSLTVLDTSANRVVRTIDLGGPTETTQLRWGEQLFHDAGNSFARQFSCRSCHPDGNHNGLTFDIEADEVGLNPVDNRSLRGIFDTPPFKWEGTNPSLRRQCGPRLAVFFTRLDPYTPDELDALVRYMCTIEQPPNRFRDPGGLTPAQRRGKAVFERTTQNDGSPMAPLGRCADCHNGAYFTDRSKHPVSTMMWFDEHVNVDLEDLFNADEFGELGLYYFVDVGVEPKVLDVPHLRNIADSPPYLHNGAAPTLEETWTRFNMVDRHGATADLTRQQMNDLIAYVKSL